jgi:AcrR family transcriptional regulator
MSLSTKKTTVPESSQTRILNAAKRCIERNGADGTTMEDIAIEAGLVRKTVYLAYGNRTALMEAVLMQQIGKNVEQVRRYVRSFATFDEAMVKGCIRHLQLIRKDMLMISLIESAYGIKLERYLLGPASPVAGLMLGIWQETFDQARAHGELRADLSDAEISDWLRGVFNQLLMRDDLSAKGQEDILRKFVLPALKPR